MFCYDSETKFTSFSPTNIHALKLTASSLEFHACICIHAAISFDDMLPGTKNLKYISDDGNHVQIERLIDLVGDFDVQPLRDDEVAAMRERNPGENGVTGEIT